MAGEAKRMHQQEGECVCSVNPAQWGKLRGHELANIKESLFFKEENFANIL